MLGNREEDWLIAVPNQRWRRKTMKRACREFLAPSKRRHVSWRELFPNARIVTDPKKMAQLNAEAEKRKQAKRFLESSADMDREVFRPHVSNR
jgi:hypothetical protein